jgi:Histidine kinase-like ATPase domain
MSGHPVLARYGPAERASSLELEPLITAPSGARSHVRATLEDWQVPAGIIRTVQTLASELTTNSYQAAKRLAERRGLPGPDLSERIGLTLCLLAAGQVVIEVADRDPGLPVMPGTSLDSESGRGLLLVDALSAKWGYFPLPSGGKVVYAVVDA